jgi:hypothetical protein
MKKRCAEKVISRSILALATYRKTTMGRALRRRPKFWTVEKGMGGFRARTPRKRLRLAFGGETGATGLTFPPVIETGITSERPPLH